MLIVLLFALNRLALMVSCQIMVRLTWVRILAPPVVDEFRMVSVGPSTYSNTRNSLELNY